MRPILIAFLAATLTGCTISTELGPGGFQGGRKLDRSVTGSNLPPRDDADYGSAKKLAPEDVGRLQQNTGSKDAGKT